MLRLNRLLSIKQSNTNITKFSLQLLSQKYQNDQIFNNSFQKTPVRFLDIYQLGSKEAIEKEKARLKDEMNRGYFADMEEYKKHGGKISMANKTIIPAIAAVKFPNLEVNYSDGKTLKLPVGVNGNAVDANIPTNPKVSLLCLSFRANSQAMINSWTAPFLDAFHAADNIHLFEVSFIDKWLLCRSPIKRLLLRVMRKSSNDGNNALQKQIVYSFGDHYYFRKELKILNLLTGYVFLLDKFGRIRWQGTGVASQEEVSSLISCTSLLLDEQ